MTDPNARPHPPVQFTAEPAPVLWREIFASVEDVLPRAQTLEALLDRVEARS